MGKTENDSPRHRLRSDREEFSRLGAHVAAILSDYLNGLRDGAAEPVIPAAERRLLRDMPLSDDGMSADDIVQFLAEHVLPWPQPTGHPRSYGWINSPPMPVAILADSMATSMNSSLDGYDYAGLYLMAGLGRWLMELVGFPETEESMALLFSGGSAANLNALSAARFQAAHADGWNLREEGLQGDHPAMTVYVSDQAHSSIQRCVEQLGLGTRYLRTIETDARFRMNPTALANQIHADRRGGLLPMAVVASAGTTNVGAIDPLGDIAAVCKTENLWLHVDGAYGAVAGVDPRYSKVLSGLADADSVTVDPHKWLHVPLDCGALLTRHKSVHRHAFTLTPDYLTKGDEHEVPWPYHYMFQLTYANRAVKTWAAIARLGRTGVTDLIVRCNDLAANLDTMIDKSDDLELLAPTSLSVVNFRYAPPDHELDDDAIDALNKQISDAIAASEEAHIPTTKVRGRVSLRACFQHYDNDDDDLEHLVGLVRKFGESAVSGL